MSETEGHIPEHALMRRPESALAAPTEKGILAAPTEKSLTLAAPTETNSETTRTPERDGWEKSGMHALLLLDRNEVGEGLDKKELTQLDNLSKEGVPKTGQADKAAAYMCDKYWEGKSSKEAYDEWSESLDKYLAKQKGTEAQEFFDRMGFTLEKGGAEAIKNRFLMDEESGRFRENNVGEFARAIVEKNDHDQIIKNMGSIRELAKLYGDTPEAVRSVLEHISALDNLRNDPEKFKETAQAEMTKGDAMAGSETLKWIKEHAGQYEKKRSAKIQELKEEDTLNEAVNKAKATAIDTKKRNLVQAKIDQAEEKEEIPQLDPDNDEDKALAAGRIRIADIKLDNKDMSQIDVFSKILEKLQKDGQVAEINDKVKDWISHEASHFTVAKEHFNNVSLIITLSKGADGKYTVHPETEYYRNDFKNKELSDEKKNHIRALVITAPGLGKDGNDIAGMSKHDMNSVHLYEYDTNDDGTYQIAHDGRVIGHPTEAVNKAREYMDNPANRDAITEYINSQSGETIEEGVRENIERQLRLRIALRLRNNPEWKINPGELLEK